MTAKSLETWSWVLIYGGLLLLCLGIFMALAGGGLGLALCAIGPLLVITGAVFIVRRARLPETASNNKTTHKE
jgi:hypothetical protein